MDKVDLKDLTYEQLQAFVVQLGEKTFRAKQIFTWLYRGVTSFAEMTDLSKPLRERLEAQAFINVLSIERKQVSRLDGTVKYLFRLMDGNFIESVVMRYKHGITICVSSQVGCRMGCGFCASTLGGLVRNLRASEIVDQIMNAQKDVGERISNIVMMGIGEPLDNYENVIKFLKNVNHKDGLNIGYRHISLSTCGVVDKINALAEENLPITLSVSLHAPLDGIRSSMMPVNRKWSVVQLMQACRDYIEVTGRRVSFEYAMVDGVNDTGECAMALAGLLRGMLCHVNLIPVNNVRERTYHKSKKKSIEHFKRVLESRGIPVTVRRELGADIDAACGQLRNNRIQADAKIVQ